MKAYQGLSGRLILFFNSKAFLYIIILLAAVLFTEKIIVKSVFEKELSYKDFTSYYIAAFELKKGVSPYSTMKIEENYINNIVDKNDLAEMGITFPIPEKYGYTYPPVVAVLLLPLTLLKYPEAHRVWQFINLIFMFFGLFFTLKVFKKAGASAGILALFVLLFLGTMPSYESYSLGQVNFLIYLLIILSFYLYHDSKIILSALFLCFAVFIKITPAILLFYFVLFHKNLKYLLYFSGFSVLFLLGSVLAIGLNEAVNYAFYIIPKLGNSYLLDNNKSLIALFTRLFKPNPMMLPLVISPFLAFLATAVVAGFFGFFAFITGAALKKKNDYVKNFLFFNFILILMLLLSPLLEIHHLMFAFPALLVLLSAGRRSVAGNIMIFTVLVIMLNTRGWNAFDHLGGYWWNIFFTAPQVIGLIVLFFLARRTLDFPKIKL